MYHIYMTSYNKNNEQTLILNFKNAKFKIKFLSDDFSKREKDKIKNIVETMGNDIWIDKSYVMFADNKHKDTFITESGWNSLMRKIISTNYGKTATEAQLSFLHLSYDVLIIEYIYQQLYLYGYFSDDIYIDFVDQGSYLVTIYNDIIHEWEYYKGTDDLYN